MRMSNWSSDVCSTDLIELALFEQLLCGDRCQRLGHRCDQADGIERHRRLAIERAAAERAFVQRLVAVGDHRDDAGHGGIVRTGYDERWRFDLRKKASRVRSEERRGGKECVSTCRSRWSPCH